MSKRLASWLRELSRRARRGPRAARSRPRLEGLEGRLAPAVYTVNALSDTGAGSGDSGDLRYCVSRANEAGDDTITFQAGLAGTIVLTAGLLTLTDTSGATTITGPGA